MEFNIIKYNYVLFKSTYAIFKHLQVAIYKYKIICRHQILIIWKAFTRIKWPYVYVNSDPQFTTVRCNKA